jgi:tetratricopeptide (TPR) repeat protein
MPGIPSGELRNTISGGAQLGPVLQGRDFTNVNIVMAQAAAAPVALAQLPALAQGFTGRAPELAVIRKLLDPAETAKPVLVSAVAGLAGVGKTTLAVHAAHAARQSGWFPGGALFIDLHGYDDGRVEPGQAIDALLRALGVAPEYIPLGTEERAGLYRSALAQISERILIVVDNASSEAQVRLLLPGPGPHRVIITSRHTLAGLNARLLDVGVLDVEAGIALLDSALRTGRPDDDRIISSHEAAARLTEMCGGLPLALQIAAALLKADPVLMVSELADELDEELARLRVLRYDDGSGTSAPSVAAAFDLSYRQLDATAAQVFRLLPLNPGPDLSTAAAAVLADLPAGDARRVLGELVRAHLIEAAAGAAGRWRMHDLLRLYAHQLSDTNAAADRRPQARDRLLRHYLETANAADTHVRALSGTAVSARFSGRDSALAWLDAERPNLVAAVTMAASTGRHRVAMSLPLSLDEYLYWRRRFDDLVTIAAVSRDAARRLGDRGYEASALSILGNAMRELRCFDKAIAACRQATSIYHEAGDRHGEGVALNNLGLALQEVRQFEIAITAHRDSAAISREIDNRYGEAMALNNLGIALREVGRLEEAVLTYEDAAAIYRETGDQHGEGMVLNNLGLTLQQMHQFAKAITAYERDLAICRETGDLHGEGITLNNLGIALREVGRFGEAIFTYEKAAAIYRETRDRHSEGMALNNLGLTLRKVDRYAEAITACQDAAAICRETGDRHGEGIALNNVGIALREVGRFEEAIIAHQDAAAIYRKIGDRPREARAVNNLELDHAAQGP